LSCLYRNYLNRRRVEVCLCFARAWSTCTKILQKLSYLINEQPHILWNRGCTATATLGGGV
jgi:hypothetical protein